MKGDGVETIPIECAYCGATAQVPVTAKSFFHRPCTPPGEERLRTQPNPGYVADSAESAVITGGTVPSRAGEIAPLMAGGLALMVLGSFVASLSAPHTLSDSTQGGSTFGVVVGIVLGSVGLILALIAIIAYGVLWGMSAYREKYLESSDTQA
ncbi:MAG TPA: hypothetical protein VN108_01300 [Marmoricola sp.]|nr:hypothetical protein [Marmoricola sp.]